jgi:catechol 2,3-dioxygenase-like lactoylglutathione lyase family enzyme
VTPPTLDHAGLTCADLERALGFYDGLLGIALLERGDGVGRAAGIPGARLKFAYLDAGEGRRLELLEYTRPRGSGTARAVSEPGATHLALLVDDLDATLARLRQAGIAPLTQPLTADGRRLVYVPDPDGRIVELIEPEPGGDA